MSSSLTREEEQLLALQEKVFFNMLTEEEKRFVLSHTTQESFDLAHHAILKSKAIYTVPHVKPLVLPIKKTSMVQRLIAPSVAAAAAVLLSLILLPIEKVIVKKVKTPIYLAADTVFLKVKFSDTVIRYQKGETIYMLDSGNSTPEIIFLDRIKSKEMVPDISSRDIKNKGESMKDDNLKGLMDGVVY
jgi:hypothetical protein